jgi:hypothetical protein
MTKGVSSMDDYSGYLFTKDPQLALDMCGHGGVRYAAELTDGRGFAAFDTNREGLYLLGTLGDVLVIAEPDHPDTWPDWARPHAPHKNFASTMNDRFALYPVPSIVPAEMAFRDFVNVGEPKAAALVSSGPLGEFFIIIEDGPDWVGPENAVWDCGVLEYRDARVLA